MVSAVAAVENFIWCFNRFVGFKGGIERRILTTEWTRKN